MKHLFGAIVVLVLLSGSVYGGQGEKAPFNLGEVMEKVAHHPRMDGDHIVIGGQAYEALFDGSCVILTSRDGEHTYRISIKNGAEPYIKDGRVCYETTDGEIQFRGTRLGLKYQRMINDPGFGKYLEDMVIGMKGKGDLAHPDRFTLSDALGGEVPYGAESNDLWIAQKDLTSLAFPLTLNGEFLIDTTIVYVPAPYDQYSPSIAFDGTNYLVVWQDERSGPFSSDIYGARVAQSGIILDPAGIAISTAAGSQYSPSIAFDGTNYLVVWGNYRSGSGDIYGARVAQSGVVIDPAGIAISTAAYDQYFPSVAFDGTNYLVVWEDERSGSDYDIYGARVDQSGVVLDPTGIAISTAAYWQCSPSVAFDGTNYLVVWQDYRSYWDYDIYGARVDQSGAVIDSFAVSLQSGNQFTPALAHGTGDQLLITYSGWTGEVGGKTYNTMRIWGKFYPFTGVEEEPAEGPLPRQFTLEQNYPNPFNPSTTIRYTIPDRDREGRPHRTTLKVYNILGQEVRTLVDEEQPAGNYRVLWDGRDSSGEEVSSGVYFCRLEVKGQGLKVEKIRKMVLIR